MTRALTPRQEIWRGLLYGQRSMLLRLATELKTEHGLPVTWYEALLALWEAPKHTLTATQLAQSLLYTSGSASHLIARLADAGLISRTASAQDARVARLSLTSEGRERIEAATQAHRASLVREFEPLIDDDEVEVLLRFARRFASHEGVSSAPDASGPADAESADPV